MEMLKWLKQYLRDTPTETVKTEWSEIEKKCSEGVNAYEYLERTNPSFYISLSPPNMSEKRNISSNLTSNFSGSFFLDILVV